MPLPMPQHHDGPSAYTSDWRMSRTASSLRDSVYQVMIDML